METSRVSSNSAGPSAKESRGPSRGSHIHSKSKWSKFGAGKAKNKLIEIEAQFQTMP